MIRFSWVYLSVIVFSCICITAEAQQDGSTDYKYNTYLKLNNGHAFYVELIDLRQDTIEVQLPSGNRILFLESQIRRLDQPLKADQKLKAKMVYDSHVFRDKQHPHFYQVSGGLLFGGAAVDFLSGANMGLAYKFSWRTQHFITANLGLDVLNGIFPVVSESLTIGYEWVSFHDRYNPYISGRIGWGLAQYIMDEEVFWWGVPPERTIESGYRAAVGTGLYFTGKKNAALNLGVELIIQQLTFNEEQNGVMSRQVNSLYRRIQFNIGYTF